MGRQNTHHMSNPSAASGSKYCSRP
eukprot:COSAG01_NODE_59814_length_298_cov_0.743719_1_plen_24_part_10